MTQQHILQVSELTKKVRFLLESELNSVWLCGEISNFIAASSGHWYLSLKDSQSQVKCAMFKGNNRRVTIKPGNGQQVLVRAKVSLYEPRGDFQLIIEHMEDAGEGLLRQQFEALKNSLSAQGLFSLAHKKPLPKNIKRIGVVTSPTGAAIKDIISVLKRRNPTIEIIIYPCLVQGNLAVNDIVYAINTANTRKECDVLIVGRGGGSLEDLWSFNEEAVVRAIFQSEIPVVSAVGHEIDTTLSDYVADLRAATPSAAAELVSQDQSELLDKLSSLTARLQFSYASLFKQTFVQWQQAKHRLQRLHPEQQIERQSQKIDDLTMRLQHAMNRQLQKHSTKPNQLAIKLEHLSPLNNIIRQQEKVSEYQHRISKNIQQNLQTKSEHFVHLIEQLHIVSPLATIARGYSVSRNEQGEIIKRIGQVSTGEQVKIQVADGVIRTKVVEIYER